MREISSIFPMSSSKGITFNEAPGLKPLRKRQNLSKEFFIMSFAIVYTVNMREART
jgi:hypothetical protein